MKKTKKPLNISVKIGLDNEWSVSEVLQISQNGFQCCLEKSLPLEAIVEIVIMLPPGPEENKMSKKIDCEGIIKSIQGITREKNEMLYQVEVVFSKMSLAEKKQILDFLNSNQN